MALALALLGAAAAIQDVRIRRVPDALSVALLATGLAAAVVAGHVGTSLAGAAVGLALLLPAFSKRWVGGGDVKLLAGLGAWVGPHAVVWTALIGLVGGGVLALAIAAVGAAADGGPDGHRTQSAADAAGGPRWRAVTVPLAVPLVAAALIVRAVAP